MKETYPDIAPVVEIEDENFENDVKSKILEQLEQTVRNFDQCPIIITILKIYLQIEENLGMEMCFSLVSVAQEQLNIIFDEIKLNRFALNIVKKEAKNILVIIIVPFLESKQKRLKN